MIKSFIPAQRCELVFRKKEKRFCQRSIAVRQVQITHNNFTSPVINLMK
jgi:hypothetical protein